MPPLTARDLDEMKNKVDASTAIHNSIKPIRCSWIGVNALERDGVTLIWLFCSVQVSQYMLKQVLKAKPAKSIGTIL